MPPQNVPPFISSQRLFLLDASHASARKCHDAIQDKYDYRRYLDPKVDEANARSLPAKQRPWGEVASRQELITNRSVRRLCVMSDAGRGKSSLLEQMEYVLNCQADFKRHMAVRIEFRQIPVDPARIVEDLLVNQIAMRFGPLENYRGMGRLLLQMQLQRAELTLLVDAMDQVDCRKTAAVQPKDHAESLAVFAKTHPNVRVVVSGRPSSVLAHWETLFSDESALPWSFVQVDEFTPEQTKAYLGNRWPFVQKMDAETLAIPRALEQVFQLEPDELQQIRTRGELYWYCLDKPFNKAIEKQQTDLNRSRAEFLLALLAIECMMGERYKTLEGDDYIEFRDAVWKKREQEIRAMLKYSRETDGIRFEEDLCDLANLNNHLDPGVIKEGINANSPGEMVRLSWHSNTTLCYYAAFWMSRYATDPADFQWLAQNLFLNGTDRDHPLYEFWRFLVEFPGSGFPLASPHSAVRKDLCYARSVSVLFDRNDQQRSAEMMWRAWPELLRLAGGNVSRESTEDQIEKATWTVAAEVHDWVRSEATAFPFDRTSTAKGVAKSALWSFLREFPELCAQQTPSGKLACSLRCYGETESEQQRPSTEARYVLCPPQWTTSTFVMGSPDGVFPRDDEPNWPSGMAKPADPWPAEDGRGDNEDPHVEIVTPAESFWLRDFVVTNAELELFLPAHKRSRPEYSRTDDQPAVYVSWYESVMFCRWLGVGYRLPSETEWECACRAIATFDPQSPQLRYWYGNDASHERMNFDVKENRTTVRGHFSQANGWCLYDMLGNVWEWCSDSYRRHLNAADEGSTGDRVLRGGSWVSDPHLPRCAVRGGDSPVNRNSDDAGFRLSRTS